MNNTTDSQAGHGIEVGTILVSRWGYDQTTVDYYEVTRATAKTVTLVKIAKRRVGGEGHMTDAVEPIPGDHRGEPFRRTVHADLEGGIAITSFAIARPWAGNADTENR